MVKSETAKLKIYKSSAGSGKTTTLVYEYLRLILQNPDKYAHILAITFTNKAANEMKQRIVEYLECIIDPSCGKKQIPAPMLDELSRELALHNLELQEQSQICLNKILHNYSDFAVSTIDSFVHKIIRSFAPDLGLPWDFDVELDTDDIFSEIINMLMEIFGDDLFFTQQIIQLIENKLNEEKSWRIERELLELSKNLLKDENSEKYINEILELDNEQIEQSRKQLNKENEQVLSRARKIAQNAMKLIRANNLDITDFSNKENGIAGYFEKIAYENQEEKVFQGNKNARNSADKQKLYPGNAARDIKTSIDAITGELINYFEQLEHLAENEAQLFYGRRIISRHLFLLSIMKIIKKNYEYVKEENQLLPITEFSRSISQITMKEDIPYIYERLGEKYQHFFIDEFQDTSTLQWENMLPLVENSLSQNHFNLIVGDVKQAIYRFRGGNINQLGQMPNPPESIQNDLSLRRYEIIKSQAEENYLNTNYRSRKEIIEFNNHFFAFASEFLSEEHRNYFADLKQDVPGKGKSGGLVKVALRDEKEHLEELLSFIQELRNDHFRFQDIAILCRTNKQAQEIAVELISEEIYNEQTNKKEKIPVISDESLTLKQSPDVNAMIAIARIMENPANKIEPANFLYHYYHTHKPKTDFTSWFESITKHDNFFISLKALGFSHEITKIEEKDLYNLFEYLASEICTDYINNPYIQYFLDEILDFTKQKSIPSLKEFLLWWEEKGKAKSVRFPDNQNAIKIKTIHKSKGLDFPVVIYPMATEKAQKSHQQDYKWVDTSALGIKTPPAGVINVNSKDVSNSVYSEDHKAEKNAEILDMINNLYVCLTRPVDRLYIISSRKEKDTNLSLSLLFTKYFDKCNAQDNDYMYPLNPPALKQPEVANGSENSDLFNYQASPNWSSKLFIRKPKTKNYIVSPSAKQKGTLIHYYLSLIKIRQEYEKVSDRIRSEITEPDLANEILQTIEQIITHDEIQPFFTPQPNQKILTEPEILTPDGILRPDRLNILPRKIILIEYKTGNPSPNHETQINNYAYSLNWVYKRDTEKFLLYTSPEIQLNRII